MKDPKRSVSQWGEGRGQRTQCSEGPPVPAPPDLSQHPHLSQAPPPVPGSPTCPRSPPPVPTPLTCPRASPSLGCGKKLEEQGRLSRPQNFRIVTGTRRSVFRCSLNPSPPVHCKLGANSSGGPFFWTHGCQDQRGQGVLWRGH